MAAIGLAFKEAIRVSIGASAPIETPNRFNEKKNVIHIDLQTLEHDIVVFYTYLLFHSKLFVLWLL